MSRSEHVLLVIGLIAVGLLAAGVPTAHHATLSIGGTVAIGDWTVTRPILLVALFGQGLGAALLVWAAASPSWQRRRSVIIPVGIWGAVTCAALLLGAWMWLWSARPSMMVPLVAVLVAGTVIGLLVATASATVERRRWLATAGAAAPFVAASAPVASSTWLLGAEVEQLALAGLLPMLDAGELVAGVVVLALLGASIRAGRDVGVVAREWVDGDRLLAALLAAKITWIVAARVNAEVGWVPVFAEPWMPTNRAGVAEWTVAVIVALIVAALLVRGPVHVSGDRVGPAFAVVSCAFVAPLTIGSVSLLVQTLLFALLGTPGGVVTLATVLGTTLWVRRRVARNVTGAKAATVAAAGVSAAALFAAVGLTLNALLAVGTPPPRGVEWQPVFDLGLWFGEVALSIDPMTLMAGVVVGVGLLGTMLVRERATRTAGIVALAFAIWSLPRGVEVLADLRGVAVPEMMPRLLTFDTVLTLAVAVGAITWWRGSQRRIGPHQLVLALVLGTVATHTAVLPDLWRERLFAMLIVAPIAYFVIIEGLAVLRDASRPPERLVAASGLGCVVLALALVLIEAGSMAPGRAGIVDLGPRLFAVPLAVVVLLATPELDRSSRNTDV